MYWYYKYPLIIILVAILFGLGVYAWRSSVSAYFPGKKAPEATETAPVVKTPSARLPELPAPALKSVPKAPASSSSTSSGSGSQASAHDSAQSSAVLPKNLQEALTQAKEALKNDNPKQARELAYAMLRDEYCQEYDAAWYELASVINEANSIFMNGKAPCPEKDTYIIKSGDNLTKIAFRNNTTVQALQRLNGLSPTNSTVHPGQALQFIKGTWSIKVSKSQFLLQLLLDGRLYRIYRVSTGRQDRTPACSFIINQKLMNPAWTYNGKSIPFGDPQNILGTRWIGLRPIDEDKLGYTGYGIHGTTEPDKIGTAASLGCVRMLNEEVEELFDFIPSSYANLNIIVTIVE